MVLCCMIASNHQQRVCPLHSGMQCLGLSQHPPRATEQLQPYVRFSAPRHRRYLDAWHWGGAGGFATNGLIGGSAGGLAAVDMPRGGWIWGSAWGMVAGSAGGLAAVDSLCHWSSGLPLKRRLSYPVAAAALRLRLPASGSPPQWLPTLCRNCAENSQGADQMQSMDIFLLTPVGARAWGAVALTARMGQVAADKV